MHYSLVWSQFICVAQWDNPFFVFMRWRSEIATGHGVA